MSAFRRGLFPPGGTPGDYNRESGAELCGKLF
jgi:hypothetical protein